MSTKGYTNNSWSTGEQTQHLPAFCLQRTECTANIEITKFDINFRVKYSTTEQIKKLQNPKNQITNKKITNYTRDQQRHTLINTLSIEYTQLSIIQLKDSFNARIKNPFSTYSGSRKRTLARVKCVIHGKRRS